MPRKATRKKGAPGRPTKLTAELRNRFVTYIRAGLPVETASAACGVSRITIRNWMRRGARGEKGFVEFAQMVDEAVANAEVMLFNNIRQASKRDWHAAAWILQRRYPTRYDPERLHVAEEEAVDPPSLEGPWFSDRYDPDDNGDS